MADFIYKTVFSYIKEHISLSSIIFKIIKFRLLNNVLKNSNKIYFDREFIFYIISLIFIDDLNKKIFNLFHVCLEKCC